MARVPILGVLGCLVILSAPALADPPSLRELLTRLGSDDPRLRMQAQAELQQLPLSHLPALEASRNHPDPEVREQIQSALPGLLNRQRLKHTLVSGPVRLRYVNATLEDALADAAEQTGIGLRLPELSVDRRWQRLTVDTGLTTPWAALHRVLQEANLHIAGAEEIAPVSQEDEVFRARARFMWGRRGRATLPRIEPSPLRLEDGCGPSVVRWIEGPLCIEAGPVPGQKVAYPEPWREVTLPLTFQIEPRFAFRGIVGVFLDEIRDEQGQRLPRSERLHDPTLGIDYFTIPRHLDGDQLGRWWYRRRLDVSIRTLERPSHRLEKVRGRVIVGLQGPVEELARVRLEPGMPPPENTATLDGGQLRFTRCENDGEGTWTLEIALNHPEQGSWVGIGTDTLADRNGTASPLRLLDRQGKPIRPAGGIIDHRNERVCLIRVNFVATEAQDGAAELIYYGRRPIELEIPFELRGLDLP